MLLFIDNYDSFTYNLVDYFGQITDQLLVLRNDAVSLQEIKDMQPEGIIISPGPGRPEDSGVSLQVIEHLGMSTPVLGICLGHQAIGQVFGARVVRASQPVHGKISAIYHHGDPLFEKIASPFPATRYHSLIVQRESLPDELKIIAETRDGLIMAMRHRFYPLVGIQFHPESILTNDGLTIIKNWYQSIKQERVAV